MLEKRGMFTVNKFKFQKVASCQCYLSEELPVPFKNKGNYLRSPQKSRRFRVSARVASDLRVGIFS